MIGIIWANLMLQNYDAATKHLAKYRKKFGQDDSYTIEKARYYALTGQEYEARELLKPLLKKEPANDVLLDIMEYKVSR